VGIKQGRALKQRVEEESPSFLKKRSKKLLASASPERLSANV
jgi:hypothetical protein